MSTMKALISILAAGSGLLYLVSGESHKHIKSVFLLLLFFPFCLLLSFILQLIIQQFSHSWPVLWTFPLFSLFRKDRNILHVGCSVWKSLCLFLFPMFAKWKPKEDRYFVQVYTSIQIHAGAETHLPSLSISWFYFIFCNYTILFFSITVNTLGPWLSLYYW